jgi:hypothetical protein
MIGQMTGQMRPGPKNHTGNVWEKRSDSGRRRVEITETINGLYTLSRRGLWRLLLFLAGSAAALQFRNFDLFAVLPENLREILGAPPPLALIHTVLAVSSISALILIAGREGGGSGECHRWLQFGLSISFFPLYAVANALDTFFPVVLTAGLLVLVTEHFAIWSQATRAIRAEKEQLARMT